MEMRYDNASASQYVARKSDQEFGALVDVKKNHKREKNRGEDFDQEFDARNSTKNSTQNSTRNSTKNPTKISARWSTSKMEKSKNEFLRIVNGRAPAHVASARRARTRAYVRAWGEILRGFLGDS